MIQELVPLLGLNSSFLELSETQFIDLMTKETFVISDLTTIPPGTSQQVEDLMADDLGAEEVTEKVTEKIVVVTTEVVSTVTAVIEEKNEPTTLAENDRESKIINEGVTAAGESSSSVSTEDVEEIVNTPPPPPEVDTKQVEEVETSTAGPDLESVLSSPDLLHLATFTSHEPESEMFQRIPSLDDLVLSCDVLTASGNSAAVIGDQTIKDMNSKDLTNCLETLGRLPWTSSSADSVWKALKSKVDLFSAPELRPIKREMMLQLQNLLPAVVRADEDLIDVSEDYIDGLSLIGR